MSDNAGIKHNIKAIFILDKHRSLPLFMNFLDDKERDSTTFMFCAYMGSFKIFEHHIKELGLGSYDYVTKKITLHADDRRYLDFFFQYNDAITIVMILEYKGHVRDLDTKVQEKMIAINNTFKGMFKKELIEHVKIDTNVFGKFKSVCNSIIDS